MSSPPSGGRFDGPTAASPRGRVDRYELLEPLGEGGFGVVWRARNAYTGQPVALKLLQGEGADDRGEQARLFKEARTAASIAHPGIVRVFDCGVSPEGQAFLAMELIAGRNVAEVLAREGALAVPRATRIARDVLDVLTAAHAVGVIHRDIKPANVLLENVEPTAGVRERVRVVDFGISKARPVTGSTVRTLAGTALGTPGFMAPEQYGAAHEADARTDVYGVGATLYTMLSGQKPFGEASYGELLAKIHSSQPEPLARLAPYVPARLASVVDRALARDPAARWQSAAQLAQALDDAIRAPSDRPSIGPSAERTARLADATPSAPYVPPPSAPITRDLPIAATQYAPPYAPAFVQPYAPPYAPVPYPPPPAPRGHGLPLAAASAVALVLLVGVGYLMYASERLAHDGRPVTLARSDALPVAPPALPSLPSAQPVEPAEAPRNVPEEGDLAPIARAPGVTVSDESVTGAFGPGLADGLARGAVTRLEACRPAGGPPVTVRVQLQINAATHLAHPDPNSDDEHPVVSRCVAEQFHGAIDPGWTRYNVILAYTVQLEPR